MDSALLRPSEKKYVEWTTAEPIDFSTALNEATCHECNGALYWKLSPDPDSLCYTAECCDKRYTMHMEEVSIDISDATI